jgi:hypothetical protein
VLIGVVAFGVLVATTRLAEVQQLALENESRALATRSREESVLSFSSLELPSRRPLGASNELVLSHAQRLARIHLERFVRSLFLGYFRYLRWCETPFFMQPISV